MNVIEQDADGATLRFSDSEVRLLFNVLVEVRNGPNAFDDDDWDMLIGQPRDLEARLIDQMQVVIDRANELSD